MATISWIDRFRHSRLDRFSSKLIELALDVNELDAFAIYNEPPTSYLRTRPNKYQKFRENVGQIGNYTFLKHSRMIRLLSAYINSKFFIITVINTILLRRDSLKAKTLAYNSTNEDSAGFFVYLSGLVGNPLFVMADLAIICHLGLVVSFCQRCYVCHGLFESKWWPLDLIMYRFSSEPLLEFRRIDSNIREELNRLKLSFDYFKQQQAGQQSRMRSTIGLRAEAAIKQRTTLENRSSNRLFVTQMRSKNQMIKDLIDRNLSLLDNIIENPQLTYHRLRPKYCSYQYYAKIRFFKTKLTLWIYSLLLSWMPLVFATTFCPAMLILCSKNNISANECGFGKVYSFQDTLVMYEVMFLTFVEFIIIGLNLILLGIQIHGQVNLIDDLKECLKMVLKLLRDANDPTGGENRVTSSIGQNDQNLHDQIMLESFVKIKIIRNELKSITKSSTKLSTFAFIDTTALILMWIGTENLINSDSSQTIRVQIFVMNFIMCNTYAILFSALTNSSIRLESLSWSILAEMLAKMQLENARNIDNRRNSTTMLDPILKMWQKNIFFDDLSHAELIVKPFNVELTYKNVFQLNFFVISIASWIKLSIASTS